MIDPSTVEIGEPIWLDGLWWSTKNILDTDSGLSRLFEIYRQTEPNELAAIHPAVIVRSINGELCASPKSR